MSNGNRNHAIKKVADRPAPAPMKAVEASIDCYGEDVFNAEVMQKFLPKSVAQKLFATLKENHPLDPTIAADVAHAMLQWAISRGATHFTHWFQPLNGGTAEKHDSFLDMAEEHAIMTFSGKNLIVGEPDASSFPSGGLRCTFEARGYTAWDPTSPAFIKRHSNGATLCIPTVFCSYTGEVLDKKTPLLRSVQAMQKAMTRFAKCFGLPEEHVTLTLGAEQEYFLVDKNFYLHRPDLIQTGRTLFGAPPAKHQQLEDHYFGSIKPRVLAFMTEVEFELWKLGIPAKTRHNEAAPAQFEVAPIFEDMNLAVDHNMLVMEVLRQVADRHGMVCLLHEKPFAGVNGSGKHNNWGITYGKQNLLEPGNDPRQNALFLTVLAAIVRAVDLHGDLLRSTTAGAGNDHRLGANEAPPAIMSIFLGDQLKDVIDQIISGKAGEKKHTHGSMRIGVDTLPTLPRDATDRNRTSPFAFTGNKFEFRGPGSSQSCAGVNMILNTIVAESLDFVADELEKLPEKKFNEGLQKLLKNIFAKHERILFNGDNYSSSWVEEAAKRNLPNLKDTPSALKVLLKEENLALFEKYGVLSPAEMTSRYEVFMEEYVRKIRIEGGIGLDIARSMILPVAASEYAANVATLKDASSLKLKYGLSAIKQNVEETGKALDALQKACNTLAKAMDGKDTSAIIDGLAATRQAVDAAEVLVDDAKWPLPKYREMLFIY